MKKLAFLILCLSLCLCISVTTVGAAEVSKVSFIDCESTQGWDTSGSKLYNVYTDSHRVKEGEKSIRIDASYGCITSVYNGSGVDISALGEDVYLEFWLYVKNEVELMHTTQAYLEISSESNCSANGYYCDLMDYEYIKGWNYVSIPLSDMIAYGRMDRSSVKCFRYYSTTADTVTVYFDDISFTSEPTDTAGLSLGYENSEGSYTRNEDAAAPEDYSGFGALMIILIVLAGCSVAGLAAVIFIKRGKKA